MASTGSLTHARQALDALMALQQHTVHGHPLTGVDRDALRLWPGWGPLAPAFEASPEGQWVHVADALDDLLSHNPAALDRAAAVCDTAFYTSDHVIDTVYELLRAAGLSTGRVLEPGCGSGRFMSRTPDDMDLAWTGVEIDPTSAQVADLLHPGAEIINRPLEKVTFRTGQFDAAIGNVPFSSSHVFDPAYPSGSLHEYFLLRAVDAVRPGGYVAVITSRYTLDTPSGLQRVLAHADLRAAVRLPAAAFKSEGTSVVADILLLQRRAEGTPLSGWNDTAENTETVERTDYSHWSARKTTTRRPRRLTITEPATAGQGYAQPVDVNRYWEAHPEHVAGQMCVTGHHRNPLTVLSEHPAEDIAKAAAAAAAQLTPITTRPAVAPDVDVPLVDADGRKEGSFHLLDNGTVHRVTDGALAPVKATAELKALIGLRDAALDLLEVEADQQRPDHQITPLREVARSRYEAYADRWGPLNRGTLHEGKTDPDTGMPSLSWRRPTMGGFRRDPDYVTVLALEDYDQDTGQANPAPILLRRVNRAPDPIERVATPGEALSVALGEGTLDLVRVASLLDLPSTEEAAAALGDLVYADPDLGGGWVTARDYLSGNVRDKLATARRTAATDPAYSRNVTALEAVLPADLDEHDIKVSLGAPWVSAADIEAFLTDVLGQRVAVTHTPVVAYWELDRRWVKPSAEAAMLYGTSRMDPYALVEHALNGKAPVVWDEEYDPTTRTTKKIRNQAETLAAEEKVATLAERFATWIWEDGPRAERIKTEYNRRFNSHVTRRHDGSHLTFPGLAAGIDLWPWQRDIVDRIVSSPRTLCGHAVGSGKTKSMICSAVTLRRFGLANKPLIVVPNHLLEQIAREAQQAYPLGKFLIAAKEDLTKDNRRLFAARCATGDWDAVVMTHQAFTSLPVNPDVEAEWLETQKADLRAHLQDFGSETGRGAKQIARMLRSFEARISDLRHNTADEDAVLFEHLGVDFIAVDECFGYDTPVLTDRGPLPIGRIVEEALPVSVASVNLSTGAVEYKPIRRWVKKVAPSSMVLIAHEHGDITCTPNHPVWVEGKGYVRAEDIHEGDVVRTLRQDVPREIAQGDVLLRDLQDASRSSAPHRDAAMRDLPRGVLPEASEAAVLLPEVLGALEDEPARVLLDHRACSRSEPWQTDARARARVAATADADGQPDERPGHPGEGCCFEEGAHLAVSEWRQRAVDGSADPVGREDGATHGVLYQDPASGASVRVSAAFLRSRPGAPRVEDGDRGGRKQSQDPQVALPRSSEDSGLGSARVVRVEVLERGSSDRPGAGCDGDRSRDQYVYNIEVADNHNYIADGVLVSNCQAFKRLPVVTRATGFSLGSSKRATDLLLKIDTLGQRNPDRPHVAFFTGTPWSNTLAETYVWQRYLQPDRLTAAGVDHFDAWAASFVRYETRVEVTPDGGGFRLHRRPSVIQNAADLFTGMFAHVADLLPADAINLQRPTSTVHNITVDPTDRQTMYVEHLSERADKIRNGGNTGDNMLVVCGDGRKVALDPRLVGFDEDSPKVTEVAARVAAIYAATKDATYSTHPRPGALQLLLCDLGTPQTGDTQTYGRLRAALAAHGVPADQIRWVHEAKTDKARAALFAACRDGEVAVLLGSTEKVGIGTNIQTRLVALHHVDAPWRPSDLEQRDGRALRPGNLNPHVDIYRYVATGTFDAYMWQTLERKARFITQAFQADGPVREIEDLGDMVLSYGEVKALATGNPHLLEQATLAAEVKRLRTLLSLHQRSVNDARRRAADSSESADRLQRVADALEAAYATAETTEPSDRETAALERFAVDLRHGRGYGATWRGIELRADSPSYGRQRRRGAPVEIRVAVNYREAGTIEVTRKALREAAPQAAAALVDELTDWLTEASRRVARLRAATEAARRDAEEARRAADTSTFAQADALADAERRLSAVEAAIAREATDSRTAAA